VASGLISTSSLVVLVSVLVSLLVVQLSSPVASVVLSFLLRLQSASFVLWKKACSIRGMACYLCAWRSDRFGCAPMLVTSVPCGAAAGCSRSSREAFGPESTSGTRRRAMSVGLRKQHETRADAVAMELAMHVEMFRLIEVRVKEIEQFRDWRNRRLKDLSGVTLSCQTSRSSQRTLVARRAICHRLLARQWGFQMALSGSGTGRECCHHVVEASQNGQTGVMGANPRTIPSKGVCYDPLWDLRSSQYQRLHQHHASSLHMS
jgi:hypothetical protein